MKGFWSTKRSPKRTPSGGAMMLTAFGKHPAWDDHIPPIGIQSELLDRAKRTLYDAGIRSQIDGGSWIGLEPHQRIAGFDHALLWLHRDQIALCRMWSSTDGKGRAEYPMALCVDGNNAPAAFMLKTVLPELELLKAACQQSHSATRVNEECAATQARLDSLPTPLSEPPVPLEAKKSFLADVQGRTDGQGLLRFLHEVETARKALQGRSHSGSVAGLFHIRVPLARTDRAQALLMWAEFLNISMGQPAAVLLISREGTDWADLIIGEPSAADLFCLQASLASLPLATEIKYEVNPELSNRLAAVEKEFLQGAPASPVPSKPPVAARPTPELPPKVPGKRKLFFPLLVGGLGLAALAAVALLLMQSARTPPSAQQTLRTTNTPPAQAPRNADYAAAMEQAKAAIAQQNFTNALEHLARALTFNSKDSNALFLQAQMRNATNELAKAAERATRYARFLAAAEQALAAGNYSNALAQADAALQLKPRDDAALAVRGKVNADQEQRSRAQFDRLTAAANGALATNNLASARTNLAAARILRPSDPAISLLQQAIEKEEARIRVLSDQEKGYRDHLLAAQTAFTNKEFLVAVTHAEEALKIRPKDPVALALKEKAVSNNELADLLKSSRAALEKKEFLEASAFAEAALKHTPTNSEAATLLKEAGTSLAAEKENRLRPMLAAATKAFENNNLILASQEIETAINFMPEHQEARTLEKKIQAALHKARMDAEYNAKYDAAVKAHDARQLLKARDLAEAALKIKPDAPEALRIKGLVQSELPRMEADLENGMRTLEIELSLRKNGDSKVLYITGNPVKPMPLTRDNRDGRTAKLRDIQTKLSDNGFLTDDRKSRLAAIEEKLRK